MKIKIDIIQRFDKVLNFQTTIEVPDEFKIGDDDLPDNWDEQVIKNKNNGSIKKIIEQQNLYETTVVNIEEE